MNKHLLTCISLLVAISVTAQSKKTGFDAGGSYSMAIPFRDMASNINLTHSLSGQFNKRFTHFQQAWVGVQVGVGQYASKTVPQTYYFLNTTTQTNARFSSNVLNLHASAGLELTNSGNVIPYVTAKAGLSNFYSSLYIEDPNDQDGCRPLENKNLINDAAFSYGGGVGLRINADKIFREKSRAWWIDISANYLGGGPISYINTKHLHDHDNSNPASTGKGVKQDLNVTFINIQSNQTHEHKIAEVYTTRINQLDFRVGVVYRFVTRRN
jgi:Outer membrane protein beta-barrel domain